MDNSTKKPSFLLSSLPIIILIGLLAANVFVFGDSAIEGPNQIALLFGAVVAIAIGIKLGFKWKDIQEGIVKSIKSSLGAILILLIIGALSGTWMISGVVPTMIYYGLQIIHPSIFLPASVIICALI